MAANIHTHNFCQRSHASVRLAQTRPNNLLPDGKRREGLGSLQPLVLCKDVPDGKSARCLSVAVCAGIPKAVKGSSLRFYRFPE